MGRESRRLHAAMLVAALCITWVGTTAASADGMVKFGVQKTSLTVDSYSKLRFDTRLVAVRWWKVTFSDPVWAWGRLRRSIRAQGTPPAIGIYWKTPGQIDVKLLVVAENNRHYSDQFTVEVAESNSPKPTPSTTSNPTPSVTPKPTTTPTPNPTSLINGFGNPTWADFVPPKFRVKQINCIQNGWSYNRKLAHWDANWQINFLMQAYDGNFVRKSAYSGAYKYVGREDRYNWWVSASSIKSLTPPADSKTQKLRVSEVALRVWPPSWKTGMASDDTRIVSTKVLFHIAPGSCIWRDPVPPKS